MTFGQILFPIDFSERSVAAASHVDAIAMHFGSKVTLLNVVDLYRAYAAPGEFGVAYGYETDLESLKERLRVELDNFGKEHLPNACRGSYIEDGEPASTIVRFAEERGFDLIMMPTHGYGPFRRLLLGSVAAKVLHDAECPVWTSAHMETTPKTHVPYRNLMCAVDLGPRSLSLIQWSSRLAESMNARLRIVHAIPLLQPYSEYLADSRFEEDLRQDARRRIADLLREAGSHAPLCVAMGEPRDVVAEEARRHAMDLVVIGRGCLKEKLGRLRTQSYGIIREAPCPVISM